MFSKKVTESNPVIVGWSLTAVMLIVLVAVPVAATVLSEFASVTDQVMVRLVPVDVGLSEVDR